MMTSDDARPWLYPCTHCGRQVDERVETVWNEVLGWEKRRAQGGTNHLAFRRPQNKFACGPCMDKLLRGIDPLQEDLWSSTQCASALTKGL